jgi:3-hydroxyacyl-CoA dehydrogenase
MRKEINIIGNGYMGSQISALYILQGYKVNIFYNKTNNSKYLYNNIKLLRKKYLYEKKDLSYEFFDDLNKIKKFPTIECINEDFDSKKKVFDFIFKIFDENIFSNTSSLNINRINHKINILHFLNPIFLGIIEVFKTDKINEDGEDIIKNLQKINFSIINMKSQDDVILNKIIFSEISEFFYLIEKKKIDKFELLNSLQKIKNFNLLNLIDVIGLDTCLSILKNLNQVNQKYYVPQILEKAVEEFILGKKNKKSINLIFLSKNYPSN